MLSDPYIYIYQIKQSLYLEQKNINVPLHVTANTPIYSNFDQGVEVNHNYTYRRLINMKSTDLRL